MDDAITLAHLREAYELLKESKGQSYDLLIPENSMGIKPGYYKFINGEYILQEETTF